MGFHYLDSWLLPEKRNGAADLNEGRDFVIQENNLFKARGKFISRVMKCITQTQAAADTPPRPQSTAPRPLISGLEAAGYLGTLTLQFVIAATVPVVLSNSQPHVSVQKQEVKNLLNCADSAQLQAKHSLDLSLLDEEHELAAQLKKSASLWLRCWFPLNKVN